MTKIKISREKLKGSERINLYFYKLKVPNNRIVELYEDTKY